ncbi:MAG: OprD family outer membrane porin [Burkholderiales bacterium]
MDLNAALANRAPWLRRSVALCGVAMASGVSAQGIYPGALSNDGYKLPGGFEPVAQLRTYYFDAESLTGSPSAAWALGGWAGLRSPWWGDVVQLGLLGYTSQRLYGPDDKDGTKLLAPGQHPITVLGEAFAAARVFGQTLTGYRQLIDRPYINPQDNRMVPNTFEAYTLSGSANDVSYTGGYITKFKARQSDSFVWMSNAAGGTGDHKGVVYAGATWTFAPNAYLRMDEQYGIDVFNTFYTDGAFPIAIDDKTSLTFGAQYTAQRSVGDAQIGSFSTSTAGLQAAMSHGPLGAQLYYTQTGTGFNVQNPFGTTPSYLELMQVAFNSAGEKAWGVGGSVNFAGLGMRGLTASAIYASGRDRINALTGASIPDRNETNVRADYAFAKGTALEGLVATLKYSWLHQSGSPQTAPQLRAYLNYAVPF